MVQKGCRGAEKRSPTAVSSNLVVEQKLVHSDMEFSSLIRVYVMGMVRNPCTNGTPAEVRQRDERDAKIGLKGLINRTSRP